ncbi:MAG: PKD domain-containing protein, partial [Firmicutes bacterium]|nr:PKD domain-containing protein [Bacillota bacterium]
LTNDIANPMIVVPVTAQISAPPMITEATAVPTLGDPPLEVAFHVAFVAPDSPVVSYGWDFGDGTTSTELDIAHTYNEVGNYTAVFSVADELGGEAKVSFPIEVRWLPHATVEPTKIEVTLPSNAATTETVTIGNVDGNDSLTFTAKVKRGSAPVIAMPERTGAVLDPDAQTAEGLCKPMDPEIVERIAEATRSGKERSVGDVILSWPIPIEVFSPWGLGFDKTNLWISDSDYYANHIVTPEGVHTGTMLEAYWAGSWPGDMAYDANHNLMWQVNVGGDNGIYGLDPTTGAVVESITSGGAWTTVSQRGLAYDDETDTFYIGGWNQDIVYHIKGLSWDEPGAIIDQWYFSVSIAGMAWHPDGVLWIASNAIPDMIYGVDVATRSIVAQFQHPFRGMNSVAGLVTNRDGNLWVMSLTNRTVYLVYTGMPISGGVSVSPGSGTVEPGETAELTVSIDAAEAAEPGKDGTKYLEILTNDPINPALHVDIIVHVEPVPSISDVSVTPSVGEPPLTVAFEAAVASTARPVVDVWWDFGDGSEPVHEVVAEHVYEQVGEYEATLHAVDECGVEASASTAITVTWLPRLEVEPEKIDVTLPAGSEKQTVLTVVNAGKAPMNFQVTTSPSFAESPENKSYSASEHVRVEYDLEPAGHVAAGIGGPDGHGYMWMDSNQPNGPKFDWVEISDVGTRVRVGDDYGEKVALPFEFPFYGELKTEIGIAAPGYLSFDTSALCGFWANKPIADGEPPNDLLAVFWDDLDTLSGAVYYYYDEPGERFIVEYKDVGQWAGGTSLTFQAILKPNGTIIYQYLSMIGNPASATVGIENASGDDGLQVVCNAPYMEDGLAVAFAPVGPIMRVNSDSGYLVSGGREDVVVTLGSAGASAGTYSLLLRVSSDDPYCSELTVPVTVRLTEGPMVKLIAPAGGERWSGIQAIEYETTGADSERVTITLEYDCLADEAGWQLIAEGLENTGKHLWDTSKLTRGGTYKVRVTAIDPEGEIGQDVSDEFTITVLSRTVIAAPNPAESLVTFYYDIETDGKLFVYDIAGRLIYSAELSAASNMHEWNVMASDRPVASGLYLYVVVTDGGERSEVGRLVIQR